MVPDKHQRKIWRQQAELTQYISALGEYTPCEFIVLLDAIDELERQIEELKEKIYGDCKSSVMGEY